MIQNQPPYRSFHRPGHARATRCRGGVPSIARTCEAVARKGVTARIELQRDKPVREIGNGEDAIIRPVEPELGRQAGKGSGRRVRVTEPMAHVLEIERGRLGLVAVCSVDPVAGPDLVERDDCAEERRQVLEVPIRSADRPFGLGDRKDPPQRVGAKRDRRHREPDEVEGEDQLGVPKIALGHRQMGRGLDGARRPALSVHHLHPVLDHRDQRVGCEGRRGKATQLRGAGCRRRRGR